MSAVEKKKNFIVNTVYLALVIALFYFFMKYAFGLFFPFLCAAVAAKLLQRPVNYICRKTPVKKGLASVIMVLLGLVLLSSVLVVAVAKLGSELKGFGQYIMIQLEDVPKFIETVEHGLQSLLSFLPDKLEATVTDFVSSGLSGLLGEEEAAASAGFDLTSLRGPLTGVWNTAKQLPSNLVAVLIAIVSCCFMTADYETLRSGILGLFNPAMREKVIRSKRLLVPAVGKMAKAYGKIILITFSELSLGLFVLKLLGLYDSGYILIIAFLTALIDIVPVLGTGTVLIPWTIYSFIVGKTGFAIGLLVIYICITVIRQIIEPKLVAAQLGIPAFASIISMFIGTKIFGFIGIFIMPMTLAMLKLLDDEGIIHITHHDEELPAETENEPAKAAGLPEMSAEPETVSEKTE